MQVGDIVIYEMGPVDAHIQNNGAPSCAAVVVRIWNESTINIRLIADSDDIAWKTSVPLGDGPGHWHPRSTTKGTP